MHNACIIYCNMLVISLLSVIEMSVWHGHCYRDDVNEARKPQMDLKASCPVGGRPGALHVSPDGSRLHVFDQEDSRLSVVGVASWQLLEKVDLGLPFIAGFGESIFLRGTAGKVEVFDAASRRFSGSILCSGDACDVAFLPELRQAVLTTA